VYKITKVIEQCIENNVNMHHYV